MRKNLDCGSEKQILIERTDTDVDSGCWLWLLASQNHSTFMRFFSTYGIQSGDLHAGRGDNIISGIFN